MLLFHPRTGQIANHDLVNISTLDETRVYLLVIIFRTASLVYGSILMAMALFKVISYRETIGIRGLSLLKTLVYDQAMYFIL